MTAAETKRAIAARGGGSPLKAAPARPTDLLAILAAGLDENTRVRTLQLVRERNELDRRLAQAGNPARMVDVGSRARSGRSRTIADLENTRGRGPESPGPIS